jgi:hypothetical protein
VLVCFQQDFFVLTQQTLKVRFCHCFSPFPLRMP